MHFRRKLKRFAAMALAVSMALSCTSMGIMAENMPDPEPSEDVSFEAEAYSSAEDETGIEMESDMDSSVDNLDEEMTAQEGELSTNEEENVENLPPSDVPDEQEEDETEDISSDDSSIPDQGEVTPAEDESYDDESDEDEQADIDEPPIEEIEDEPVDDQMEEDTRTAIERAIEDRGYAYVVSECSASVYEDPFLSEDSLFFTTDDDYFIMLATGYNDVGSIRVSFLTTDGEVLTGYIAVSDLWEDVPTGRDLVSAAGFAVEDIVTPVGVMTMYWLIGTKVTHPAADPQDTPWIAQPGDFIAVTPDTRAFVCVDETLDPENDYDGDNFAGYFINEAILQVDAVEQDRRGNTWYKARFLYGEALDNGKYLFTAVGYVYLLAAEAMPTDEHELTITDHVIREAPDMPMPLGMDTTYMNGFSLRNCSSSTPYVYAGQSGVYATSGHDNEYPQIASLPGHGTIFATPHYINNCVVYCLEHTMPGPNQSDGDGGRHPTGPYNIVDLDTYERTKGPSGYIFKTETMHAIAWVLRHTVPFMELARSDANNTVWSRVAGQFAIREVICEMEGDFYVRDYWIMDEFVRQAGQAPAVYLTYARWLAENGLAYGRRKGNITISNKSMRASGSGYVATATLTTDADRMRISRDVGNLTGNSGGSDWQYYYVRSGDTISVTTSSANLAFAVQSLPSSDDEANFLVGIPEVDIQKVLIPQDGDPIPMKSVVLSFDVPMGSLTVTKKSTSGTLLSGAIIELVNSSGSVVATQTTGSNGVTTFSNLQPGSYTVREKNAPQGYLLSATSTQQVQVTAGGTATATFTNEPITGKIKIVKTDSSSKKPLPGATFTVTRLSGPVSETVSDIGKTVATITTNAQGIAETGLLPWGEYRITETGVPAGYLNPNYSTTAWIK